MDPLKLPLEELLYLRLGTFLDQLSGRRVPELYQVLRDQLDRALLRQALERNDGQVGQAAEFLGMDRNTLARKLSRLKVARTNPAPTAPSQRASSQRASKAERS